MDQDQNALSMTALVCDRNAPLGHSKKHRGTPEIAAAARPCRRIPLRIRRIGNS